MPRRAIVGQHGANGPRACFAGETYAIQRIHHAPGKDKIQRCLKVVGVFLEEWALLRKENFKPLVHRNLGIVGFNLAEIRIESGVQHQAVLDYSFCIETGLGLYVLAGKTVSRGIAFIERAKRSHRSIRNELEVVAG